MGLELTSAAFELGETIPSQYTCEGKDVSPPLAWRGVPRRAQSLVLVCDDPDSRNGPWSHWVLYDIPADRDGLEENVPPDGHLSWGGVQGRNDFGNPGCGGPCPSPPGSAHHYYFRLYALDEALRLPPGATRQQVLDRIRGHILDQTELMGLYARS
jgi:Raf kinase inhibitor-like YbhB/YbcL family protein